MVALKGAWVEIENILLDIGQRAPQVPEDTLKTPLVMWIRGFLMNEKAEKGDTVTIKTLSGRMPQGTLVDISPRFEHDFGCPQTVLIETGMAVRQELGEL